MDITLALLKPDCIQRGLTGKVIDFIESRGFEIVAIKKLQLTKVQAEAFYSVHNGKSFFPDLVKFMTSGPCCPMVLRRKNAVIAFREATGATDPGIAKENTLRKLYGENIQRNLVHCSDSEESAKKEIVFFFSYTEIIR